MSELEPQDELFLKEFKRVLEGRTDLDLEAEVVMPALDQFIRNVEEWAHDEIARNIISLEQTEQRLVILGYWKAILEAVRNVPEEI